VCIRISKTYTHYLDQSGYLFVIRPLTSDFLFIPNILDCLAKGLLYGHQMSLIPIRMARPKKTFQAVLLSTRNNMNVQMRHTLAHVIVDANKSSFSHHRFFERPRNPLGNSENGDDQGRGQIDKGLIMGLGDNEAMSGEQRPVIEESQCMLVFIDSVTFSLALNDFAEPAIRVQIPDRLGFRITVLLQHTDVQPSGNGP
jgi:hypothetical protein